MENNESKAPAKSRAKKAPSFEQQLTRLGEIVRALEAGDTTLADSLKLFEEGAALVAFCTKELDEAEQRVVKLRSGPDGETVEEPFGEDAP